MSYTHKTTPLPETYDTAAIEKKWQKYWEEHKIYAWDASVSREDSFVIDTPPPTVSGTLHMGHVFSYTQADFVARFQRMAGKNVFYPMGFDDNGLPTERLVEKEKKIRAVDKSREEFIQICLGVSEEARKEFRALFESIALSVDWAQEYHTISDSSRALSQASFLDLVNKGHCYRALRPFYWDPVDQTAIAQAEIVDKEMASHQNIILFEVDGVKLPVMTTRPELLPACVALMYHPDDAAKYEGKEAITPLFGVRVPMIADEKVDKEKGTGLVMCCTFGDDTDKEWWEKYDHLLPTRSILNKYGKIDFLEMKLVDTQELPEEPNVIAFYNSNLRTAQYHSDLSAKNCEDFSITLNALRQLKGKRTSNPDPKNLGARETIIAMLKEAGLLTEQKPITHAVKCAERSGAPLEILPSEQWFVKVSDKKEALKARTEECTWHPEWMKLRMLQWIDGLNQDWCISRQRYFGVPFPVWYVRKYGSTDAFTAVYPQPKQSMPVNPLAELPKGMIKIPGLTFESVGSIGAFASEDIVDINGNVIFSGNSDIQLEVVPDFDVMDTWATSSISPQLSAHAIHASPDTRHASRFEKLFPADLRPQAHEIIRTWAFYTLVKAHLHNASIPWHNLMISGWCLAEDKTKMSKSKGNVVTPVALIEEKGTDAVRYWAATSRLGQDTAFSPDLLKIGKKLVNKLWNATQFAAIHLSKMNAAPQTAATDAAITEVLDQWILSRLGETVKTATDAFNGYEYAVALDATNQFFWADFCDNYLELIKARVYNEEGKFTGAQQQSAVRALYYCLEGILKLYAPIVPHVTEELYSHIFAEAYAAKGSLHARGQWVKLGDYKIDQTAIEAGRQASQMLALIRGEKSNQNRSVKYPVQRLGISEEYTQPQTWMADVCGAGNVQTWVVQDNLPFGAVDILLAETADAA